MTRPAASKDVRRKSTVRKIHEVFGEESTSDEDDFESVSTNRSATNYNLEYTSQSLKETAKSKSPRKAQSPPKSRESASEAQASTRKVQGSTNKAKGSTGKTEASTSKAQAGRKTKASGKTQNVTSPLKSVLKSPIAAKRKMSLRKSPAVPPSRSPNANTSRVRFSTHPSNESAAASSSRRGNMIDTSSATSHASQAAPGAKKTNRRKQSKPKQRSHVLQEIQRLQRSMRLLIPKLTFSRLIREVLMTYADTDMRISVVALEAIQEAAEMYLVQMFEDSYRCTMHRNRVTLMVKDMELVRFLRGPLDVGNY